MVLEQLPLDTTRARSRLVCREAETRWAFAKKSEVYPGGYESSKG